MHIRKDPCESFARAGIVFQEETSADMDLLKLYNLFSLVVNLTTIDKAIDQIFTFYIILKVFLLDPIKWSIFNQFWKLQHSTKWKQPLNFCCLFYCIFIRVSKGVACWSRQFLKTDFSNQLNLIFCEKLFILNEF